MPRARVSQNMRTPTIRRTRRVPLEDRLEMLVEPVTIWEHLSRLAKLNLIEDTLLLYEVTNQSTSSNRYRVPTDPVEFDTYLQVCEFYDKTKRFAQACAILKTIIATFPNQRPFSYPSIYVPVPKDERRIETEKEIESRDYVYYCLYCTLQKTNKLKEALEALTHIRGTTYITQKEQEMRSLISQMKQCPGTQPNSPEPWKPDVPVENNAKICSSALDAVALILKSQNHGDPTLARRFAAQFIGNDMINVYWWLKSAEAVGQNKNFEAIACLRKMTHQNPRVLTQMARLNYEMDKRDEARRLLKTAHAIDPLWIDGMDMLAFLCLGEDFQDLPANSDFLEGLITTLEREWPHRVETLTVSGFVAHQVDLDLARALSNRAMRCAVPGTDQYIYAAHLKVYCLRTLELKVRNSDILHDEMHSFLEEVVEIMPHSPDLALLYVDTLLEDEEGHRNAKIFATKFLHENPNNVHAKLLKVHVLVNGITRNPDVNHTPELLRLLEEITTDYPHILSGFSFLLGEYERSKSLSKCREVVEKLNAARPLFSQAKTPKYHRLKVEYMLKMKDIVPAYQHLMAAIATGAVIDVNTMATYEAEIQKMANLSSEYRNLEFLDRQIVRSVTPSEHSVDFDIDMPGPSTSSL
uniref:Uncharacterized protein n=2 Tax=Caenorhabditis japonica TaxID=281687 RepID=A0A8R1DQ45_CAEJA